jgi:hypothetical protein
MGTAHELAAGSARISGFLAMQNHYFLSSIFSQSVLFPFLIPKPLALRVRL